MRRLDRLEAQVIPGSEGAIGPFFSPDGERLAFFADGSLKKIPAIGGAIVSICAVANPRGGGVGRRQHHRIRLPPGRLTRVSGGRAGRAAHRRAERRARSVVAADSAGRQGRVYLEAVSSLDSSSSAQVVVKPLPSGDPKVVLRGGGMMPRYVETGHLTSCAAARCSPCRST